MDARHVRGCRLGRLALLDRRLLAAFGHRLDLAAFGRDLPRQLLAFHAFLGAGITRVGVHRCFLAVQQFGDDLDVRVTSFDGCRQQATLPAEKRSSSAARELTGSSRLVSKWPCAEVVSLPKGMRLNRAQRLTEFRAARFG